MFFDRDKWQEIFGTIRKHKLRTALTAFGVFWGIFMLVFILGMGAGLENGVFRDFGDRATNCLYAQPWRTSLPYNGFPPGRRPQFSLEDIEVLKAKIPELGKIATRYSLYDSPMSRGDKNDRWELRGELTGMIDIEALKLFKGRYLSQRDIDERRKVAVIGNQIADVLFGEEDPIGKHILIRGVDFIVIGVYGPQIIKPWTESDQKSAVIPLPTMSTSFGTRDKIEYFVCTPIDGFPVSELEEKVKGILKEIHNVHPDDKQGIGSWNMEEEFKMITGLFTGIRGFLWFVGIGTLLAGIIGVSNIMLIIVKERTKEIGIRKALGAKPGSIINMILTESIFLTSISGYLGLAVGTLVVFVADQLVILSGDNIENYHHPEVNATVGILAVVTLVVAGTFAGLIPALQASRVNPVVALKDE
ncbi:MAG: ABC transporter permease [Bacteroidota bacterium]